MRRRAPILPPSAQPSPPGRLIAAGLAAVPATAAAAGGRPPAPSVMSLPITGYYQMAVDSADSQVFISQGATGRTRSP